MAGWRGARRAALAAPVLSLLLPSAEGEVSCGGHNATRCADCPEGHGPTWCHGDCVWRGGICGARAGAYDWVSCGGHEAASCAECHGERPDEEEDWCNGDCVWLGQSGRCVAGADIPELDELLGELGRLGRAASASRLSQDHRASFLRSSVLGRGSRQKQSDQVERRLRAPRDRAKFLDALFALLQEARSDDEARDLESLVETVLQWHSNRDLRRKLKRARTLTSRGMLDDALGLCEEVTASDSTFAEAWFQQSVVLAKLGASQEETLRRLHQALEIEPRHFGALVAKGELLAARGARGEALKCLQQAKEIHPRLHSAGLEGLLESMRQEKARQTEL